jgi:hypothetical protein
VIRRPDTKQVPRGNGRHRQYQASGQSPGTHVCAVQGLAGP